MVSPPPCFSPALPLVIPAPPASSSGSDHPPPSPLQGSPPFRRALTFVPGPPLDTCSRRFGLSIDLENHPSGHPPPKDPSAPWPSAAPRVPHRAPGVALTRAYTSQPPILWERVGRGVRQLA